MTESYPRAPQRPTSSSKAIADELVVYDLASKKPTGSTDRGRGVQTRDGKRSLDDLAAGLAHQAGLPADEALVRYCVAQLDRRG